MRPIAWTRSRRGTNLLSTVVALGLIAMALSVVLQAYVQGRRMAAVQAVRLRAAVTCQEQLELARAAGYGRLSLGQRTFAVPGAPAATGQVTVTTSGAGVKPVTARVTWPPAERHPAGQVELTTVITARGLTP